MSTSIEPLENRIAPATFSFLDHDGDLVRVSVTGTEPLNLGDEIFLSSGNPLQPATLEKLDLSKPAFAGKAVAFSVNKARFGDGKVNVGYIDATGIDLAKVVVPGDLGRITVGDSDTSTPALTALTANSMGIFGLATQGNTGNLESEMTGPVGTVIVAGNVIEATVTIRGTAGLVQIRGDLVGGDVGETGRLLVTDKATVRIAGDVVGGDGVTSGSVVIGEGSSLSIVGALIGGFGTESGSVVVASGSARVGAIIGGEGSESGYFYSDIEKLESLIVQRSIIGGSGLRSGFVYALGDVGKMIVRGSIMGGSGPLSGTILLGREVGLIDVWRDLVGGSVAETGTIRVDKFLAKAIIRGSIIAGIPAEGTVMGETGGIYSQERIGSVVVRGDMMGSPRSRTFIAAGGHTDPGPERNLAINRITVQGDVAYADIFAGILLTPNGVGEYQYIDADASIGTVNVGGNWRASNIVAGAEELGAIGYGNGDALITVDNDPNKIAQIASIVIKGQVSGTFQRRDFYGFVAEHILGVSIGGVAYALELGKSNDEFLIPGTNDVGLLEVEAAPAM